MNYQDQYQLHCYSDGYLQEQLTEAIACENYEYCIALKNEIESRATHGCKPIETKRRDHGFSVLAETKPLCVSFSSDPPPDPEFHKTYQMIGTGFKCLICGHTSYNLHDVTHGYCGYCKKYHL